MPENTICVTRGTPWGNRFKVGIDGDTEECIRKYVDLLTIYEKDAAKRELRGKNLACFCSLDQPCHADVLLEIANE